MSDNFFLRIAMPISSRFSGLSAPEVSTLKKNLLGLPVGSNGAWAVCWRASMMKVGKECNNRYVCV